MANYKSAFPDEYSGLTFLKANAPITTPSGKREATLTSGSWISASDGSHYCDVNSNTNPISINNRIKTDFFRKIQHYLHFQFWLAGDGGRGWRSADSGFLINASANNNFSTWFAYEIVSASSKTLTLKLATGDYDPRDTEVYFALGRVTFIDPLTRSNKMGTWFQPGDQVTIVGNSVLAGRIAAKIVNRNFAGLTNPVAMAGDQFTITLTHNVSYALTKSDPSSSAKAYAYIWREAWRPEFWQRIEDLLPMFCIPRTITLTAPFASDGIIELTNPAGGSIRCAAPMAANDFNSPDYTIRVKIDGVDKTTILRSYNSTDKYYYWNRFAVTHEAGNSYKTRLYLGATDYTGAAVTNLLAGAASVEIFYMYQSTANDTTPAGARSPCPVHCHHCKRDFNDTIGNSNTNGTAISADGSHWYCAMRDNADVTATNLNNFRAPNNGDNGCYQITSCKRFEPARPGRIDESWWANIYNARNIASKQLTPGWANTNNYRIVRLVHPSFRELFDIPDQLKSLNQYYGIVTPLSGGFGRKLAITADSSGNESISFLQGLIYNAYGDLNVGTNWGNNQTVIDDMRGVISRYVSTYALAQAGVNQELNDTSDPGKVLRWNSALLRQSGTTFKDSWVETSSLQYSARLTAGIEGENRIQRFNRRTQMIFSGINKNLIGTLQTNTDGAYIQFGSAPITVGAHTNIKGIVQMYADGKSEFGYRRIGGRGTNGQIISAESLGGGVYRLHSYPGLAVVSKTVAAGIDSFDDTQMVWTGANVGNLPDPLKPFRSYYNNINDQIIGLTGAREGDVLEIDLPSLNGVRFWIKRAVACAGNDFSGISGTSWAQPKIIGSFFNPALTGLLSDGLNHTVVITDLEIKFISGSWQYQTALGNPKLNRMTYAERPTTAQDIDLASMGLDWMNVTSNDLYVSGATNGSATGNVITDAGSPGWTVNYYVGMLAYIDSTASYYRIASNTGNTLTIGKEFNLSLVNFRFRIKYAQTTINIGDSRGFPTYAMYYWAFATTSGLLAANRKYRVSFTIDGSPQSAQEITLDPPNIQLTFPGDISKQSKWSVYVYDPFNSPNDPYKLLNYEGELSSGSSSFYDLNQKPSFNGWKWHGGMNSVVFHPNRAGYAAIVYFETTSAISLGKRPDAGYIGFPSVTNQDFLYKSGIIDFYDEDGLIAALGISALANIAFYVNTAGVIWNDGTLAISYRATGDTTWLPVIAADWIKYYANGRFYISTAAHTALPATFDLKIDAPFANRSAETSADMIERLINCVEATDEVQDGLYSTSRVTFTLQGDAYLEFNSFSLGPDGQPYGDYLKNALCLQNNNLPPTGALITVYGLTDDGSAYPNDRKGRNDYSYYTYADPGYLTYGCKILKQQPGAPPSYNNLGAVGNGIHAAINAYIYTLGYSHIQQAMPDGTTILEAQIPITIPTTAQIVKETYYIHAKATAPGWEDNFTSIAQLSAQIRCALIGQTNDGKWHPLKDYQALGTGVIGRTTVIDFTQIMIDIMLTYRNSQYKQIGFYVAVAPDNAVNVINYGNNVSASAAAAIIPTLIATCSSYTLANPTTNINVYPGVTSITSPGIAHCFDLTATNYRGDPPSVGNIWIKYRLPDSVVKDMRITYGNWPSLARK